MIQKAKSGREEPLDWERARTVGTNNETLMRTKRSTMESERQSREETSETKRQEDLASEEFALGRLALDAAAGAVLEFNCHVDALRSTSDTRFCQTAANGEAKLLTVNTHYLRLVAPSPNGLLQRCSMFQASLSFPVAPALSRVWKAASPSAHRLPRVA